MNNVVKYTEGINHLVWLRMCSTFSYYLSEIVMILCLCHSINQVLRTLIIHAENLDTMTSKSSLLDTDEISLEEKEKLKRFTINNDPK